MREENNEFAVSGSGQACVRVPNMPQVPQVPHVPEDPEGRRAGMA